MMIQGSIDDANFAALAESMNGAGKTTANATNNLTSIVDDGSKNTVAELENIENNIKDLSEELKDEFATFTETFTGAVNDIIKGLTAIESKIDFETLTTVQNNICAAIKDLKEDN